MEEIKCEQVGMSSGGKWDKLHDQSRRVYGVNGLAPTMHTCGGGNLEPKIAEPIAYDEQNGYLRQDDCVGTLTTDGSSPKHNNRIVEPRICAMRGRNPDNPSDRTAGSPTEQRLEIGSEETSNTLTTVQKDNLVVEPKVVNPLKDRTDKSWFFEQNVYAPEGLTRALKAGNGSGNIPKIIEPITQDYRIRKLTERECFRLMGVKSEDFEKVRYGMALPYDSHKKIVNRTMEKAEWKECWRIMRHNRQSVSSCYHLVGDSIVTTCLMAIFGELFGIENYTEKINNLVEELKQK